MSAYRTAEELPRGALLSQHHGKGGTSLVVAVIAVAIGLSIVVAGAVAGVGTTAAVGLFVALVPLLLLLSADPVTQIALYERTLLVATRRGAREVAWDDVIGLESQLGVSTMTVNDLIVSRTDRHVLELRSGERVSFECVLDDNDGFLTALRARVEEQLAPTMTAAEITPAGDEAQKTETGPRTAS